MAKGSGRGGWIAAGLILLVVVVSTNVWNPFPGLWEWVSRTRPIASPDAAWQQRLGGGPKSVTITGAAAVVEFRTSVEGRSMTTGVRLWEKDADWSAVAGVGDDAVAVVGKLLTKGYEVLDPDSGIVLRRDDQSVAVWTYRDALLDVRCTAPTECTLTAWDPRGTDPRWRVDLPGIGFVLFADNPDLLDARPFTAHEVASDARGPVAMPPMLGFAIDDQVRVVDTTAGRVATDFKPDRADRYALVAGRLVRVQARSADGTCYFSVSTSDPATGTEVWRHDGLNPRTVSGAGCAQRDDPTGAENILVGTAADGREVAIDGYDGRVRWIGKAGEKVQGVDDRDVVVRLPDGTKLAAYPLGSSRTRWTYSLHDPKGQAALTPYAVVVVQEDPNRIVALAPRTGRELVNIRSSAKVWAVGPTGMIIGEGRHLAYVPFAGTATSTPAPGVTPTVPGGRTDQDFEK
ncbi:PQQ-binding-like beta-propeller repeat protein [Actinomycetes bacterium KLBMP 9797]